MVHFELAIIKQCRIDICALFSTKRVNLKLFLLPLKVHRPESSSELRKTRLAKELRRRHPIDPVPKPGQRRLPGNVRRHNNEHPPIKTGPFPLPEEVVTKIRRADLMLPTGFFQDHPRAKLPHRLNPASAVLPVPSPAHKQLKDKPKESANLIPPGHRPLLAVHLHGLSAKELQVVLRVHLHELVHRGHADQRGLRGEDQRVCRRRA